jgi:signal transduction histidine kinase
MRMTNPAIGVFASTMAENNEVTRHRLARRLHDHYPSL